MAFLGSLLHGLSQAAKKEAARLGSHPRVWLGQNLLLSLHGCQQDSAPPRLLEQQPPFPIGWKASSVLCLVGVSSVVAVLSECTSPEGNEGL